MPQLDETPVVGEAGHTSVHHPELSRLHNILDGSTKTTDAAQVAAALDATAKVAVETAARAVEVDELSAAIVGHAAAADPHAGYRLESVPITAAMVAADVATQAELDAAASSASSALAAVKAAGLALVNYTDPVTAVRPTGWAGVLWRGPLPLPTNMDATLDLHVEAAGATSIAGSRATETDTGQAGTLRSSGIGGGLATETDTGQAGVLRTSGMGGGQATETDTGQAGSIPSASSIPGSQATETDTGQAGVLRSSGMGGAQATETDTGQAGSITTGDSDPFTLEVHVDRYLFEDTAGPYLLEV